MTNKTEFTLNPEDEKLNVLRVMNNLIRKLLGEKVKLKIVVSVWKVDKTPAQHRTIWMWDSEIAAQLNVMGAMSGAAVKWKPIDAHEMIFKGLCMPRFERQLIGGDTMTRPMGLSDKPSKEQVSEAMEKYQCWAAEHGIDLTQPIDQDMAYYEGLSR